MSKPFKVGPLDHVEVFVPSRREAAAWYEATLGLQVVERCEHWADDPRGPLMISSDGGSTMLALFRGEPQRDHAATGPYLVAFRVDGPTFCAFLGRLEALPVYGPTQGEEQRQLKPSDVSDHGQAFSIYFTDPYGNRYEITSYDEAYLREHLPC